MIPRHWPLARTKTTAHGHGHEAGESRICGKTVH